MSETRLVWIKVVPAVAEARRRASIVSVIIVEMKFNDALGVIIGFIPMSSILLAWNDGI